MPELHTPANERGYVRRFLFLCLLFLAVVAAAPAEEAAGDWIGQMNGSFKVHIHIEKAASGYAGKLINPSGNETILDQVTSDGAHLHFSVAKLNLSYDATWNVRKGSGRAILRFSRFIRWHWRVPQLRIWLLRFTGVLKKMQS